MEMHRSMAMKSSVSHLKTIQRTFFFFFLHILTLNKEDEDPIILNKYILEKFGPQSCINNLLYVSSRWFKVTE